MSFRLWTIFYVFALVGAAMATFGAWGIVPAALVLCFWAAVFYYPKWPLTPVEYLVVLLIIGFLIALLLPAVQSARESSRIGTRKNNLKQLAIALSFHAEKTAALPPPYLADQTA